MPPTKSAMQGGQTTGVGYDDGGDYDGVKKVVVTTDGTAIRHIKFHYDKAGNEEIRERGFYEQSIIYYCSLRSIIHMNISHLWKEATLLHNLTTVLSLRH
ncbi:unnamed protein product [Brassica rapa]|uniref:Jacalin-type lectin domain-containing protein n=1 Tax=Brassica campestris TaxID=3711 RepID=A0A8D9DLL7_BRACM|nr:unnamed protein product [Brassica rapa]